jgi:RimJ/RimL family protein N-acetyltransferase
MDPAPSEQPEARRVGRESRRDAAARLVAAPGLDPIEAGRRFVQRAREHGIDLDLLWAIGEGARVRQSALVVPQAGRTAMMFISGEGPPGLCGSPERQLADRIALVRGVISQIRVLLPGRVHLVQALPAPEEWWAIEAFRGGGMTRLGDLAYLRRPLSLPALRGQDAASWPGGVEIRPFRGMKDPADADALRTALARSYIDTLDCPGLCDMRDLDDVIDSHLAAGRHDPALWWLVWHEGRPEGCVLLSPCPDQDAVELVYMGLGPSLRGRRLSGPLLEAAIARAQRTGMSHVTCAVDEQNEPARALYASLGFTVTARRVAFVASVRDS